MEETEYGMFQPNNVAGIRYQTVSRKYLRSEAFTQPLLVEYPRVRTHNWPVKKPDYSEASHPILDVAVRALREWFINKLEEWKKALSIVRWSARRAHIVPRTIRISWKNREWSSMNVP
jgi:hypothetical protein